MAIAAIDFGRKRVGLAVLETGGLILPVGVIEHASEVALYETIRQRMLALKVEHIVVGWPINMDGSAGPQAKAAERFAQELRLRTGLKVELHDERLTSFEARARAANRGRRRKQRNLDALAACVLLESWLQAQAR